MAHFYLPIVSISSSSFTAIHHSLLKETTSTCFSIRLCFAHLLRISLHTFCNFIDISSFYILSGTALVLLLFLLLATWPAYLNRVTVSTICSCHFFIQCIQVFISARCAEHTAINISLDIVWNVGIQWRNFSSIRRHWKKTLIEYLFLPTKLHFIFKNGAQIHYCTNLILYFKYLI